MVPVDACIDHPDPAILPFELWALKPGLHADMILVISGRFKWIKYGLKENSARNGKPLSK
jgi:hypothetical protein